MRRTYSFEKLEVWQIGRKLTKEIYLLAEKLPAEEKFNITSQIKRCALSIPTNLAEGSGRITEKDKAHFTVVAYGSLMELVNLLILSEDLNFIKQDISNIWSLVEELSNKLNALRNSQLNK